MMVKYFYVQLNENSVGVCIISSCKKLNTSNAIEIPEYNETYIGRMWDGTQWSQERYDSSIEIELQQKVEQLEKQNNELITGINTLQQQNIMVEGMLLEMLATLATLAGGAE